MDEATKVFYELRFQAAFLEEKGAAFQDLFAAIMSKAFPGDFLACRPWGAAGDRKNDGYLKSERLLFQVYAPNELKVAQTVAKIREDFTEALPYWKEHFDTWVFVHNANRGLPPDVIATLLELDRENAPIKVTQWGYEELLLRFQQLSLEALRSLYGSAPQFAAPRTALRETITIIIPVFNEKTNILRLIKGLRAEGLTDHYRIMICDDGSTDNSLALMLEHSKSIASITCLHNPVNTGKVGAIERMVREVQTPFVLTMDADCVLTELQNDALERLLGNMRDENYAATCFRIIPDDHDWLDRLQKLDYTIFTDALRRLLGVPVCLIGQGVVWQTDSFREVLAVHSKQYHGDDLENTLIALTKGMRLYWERNAPVLTTVPKDTMLDLLRQRGFSWDFGMFRVLLSKRAMRLGGQSGAFYKNLLLIDLLAHPLRLVAIPLLSSVILFNALRDVVISPATMHMYFRLLSISFDYGTKAVLGILTLSIVVSAICVRGRPLLILKWAGFNFFYLSSPFVFFMYYPLAAATRVSAEDVFGAAVHWFGLGLLLTYVWWVVLTFGLLCLSSLQRKQKRKLLMSVLFAPLYYFVLLVACKTTGICKTAKVRAFG